MIGDRIDQNALLKNNFSLTRAYFFRDDTTWCVRQAKQIPSWMNIFYIATVDVNLLGVTLLIVSIFLTYLFTSFEEHPEDIWKTLIMFLQVILLMSSPFKPKRRMLRLFHIAGLYAMLATTSIFLAFYYNFMLQPRYERQIDTFDQIVSNNFLLAGDEHTKEFLMQQNRVNT